MVVTQELFAAYLNCPTKAYLMRSVIPRIDRVELLLKPSRRSDAWLEVVARSVASKIILFCSACVRHVVIAE